MKNIALFLILLGGVMLVGCPKPATKSPPATGTAPTANTSGVVAPGAVTPGASTTTPDGSTPVVKDGPQPIAELPATQTQNAID